MVPLSINNTGSANITPALFHPSNYLSCTMKSQLSGNHCSHRNDVPLLRVQTLHARVREQVTALAAGVREARR